MKTPIENLRLPRTGKSTLYEVMSAAILLHAWIAGIVATSNHKTSGRIVILLIVFSVIVALMHSTARIARRCLGLATASSPQPCGKLRWRQGTTVCLP